MRSNHSVFKRDLQLFFKRLRKRCKLDFKYFACGEYGSRNGRPHYHAIILFSDFISKVDFEKLVSSSWHFGIINVQDSISDSAIFYTARYCDKKIEDNLTSRDYAKLGLLPPFILSSRGLGFEYFKQHQDRILQLGYIQGPNGVQYFIPSYFVRKLDDSVQFDYKVISRFKSILILNKNVQNANVCNLDYFTFNLRLDDIQKSKRRKLVRIL